jgi:hypothetical protein
LGVCRAIAIRREGRVVDQAVQEAVCAVCGRVFDTRDDLDRHMAEAHPEAGAPSMNTTTS